MSQKNAKHAQFSQKYSGEALENLTQNSFTALHNAEFRGKMNKTKCIMQSNKITAKNEPNNAY